MHLPTEGKKIATHAFSKSEAWQRSTVKSYVDDVIGDGMLKRVFQARCAICAHAHG